MTDENMARPFSGEIMAGGPREASSRPLPAADVIDAEYVTVDPSADPAARRPAATPPAAAPGMDILRAEAERRRRERGGPLFWAGGLFIVAAAFWVSGGHALVVRPQPASLSRATEMPLRIAGVESRVERQGVRAFLLVDGEVANDGGGRETVPGLEISVAGRDGRTTRYFLGTSDRVLAPGERFAFSSRLDAPKDGVESVTVDFSKEGRP